MKKFFTPSITLILLTTTLFAQQIPNASFEDWKYDFDLETDKITGWKASYDYFNEDQPVQK